MSQIHRRADYRDIAQDGTGACAVDLCVSLPQDDNIPCLFVDKPFKRTFTFSHWLRPFSPGHPPNGREGAGHNQTAFTNEGRDLQKAA